MYGSEIKSVTNRFELRTGQRREPAYRDGTRIIKNAGWYNKDGDRLGWGDLDATDIDRITAQLEPDEYFVVLGQQDAFHDFEAQWRRANPRNKRTPNIAAPGRIYIAQRARYIIGSRQCWRVVQPDMEGSDRTECGIVFKPLTPRAALALLDN
jgi:hypothetical protein